MINIKEDFIIDEKEFNNRDSERLIKDIIDFVKITKEGRVLFVINSIDNGDKVALVAIARFLANNLEKSIHQEITPSEVAAFTSLTVKIVTARLSDLTKQRIIRRIGQGKYVAAPYQMDSFIKKINKKYGGKNDKNK